MKWAQPGTGRTRGDAARTGLTAGLLLAGLLLATGPVWPEEQAPEPALAAFLKQSRALDTQWRRGSLRRLAEIGRIEMFRGVARENERAAARGAVESWSGGWEATWAATRDARRLIHADIRDDLDRRRTVFERVVAAHAKTPLSVDARRRVAETALWLVSNWCHVGEPADILRALKDRQEALVAILGWHRDAAARRTFLAEVATRVARTPRMSDLDVLCHVIDWAALLAEGRASGKAQLDPVSADLILLFTERGTNGVTRSKSGYYVAGRFKDRGFRKALRDGGDQVRHFCWAFRMFAISQNPNATQQLLALKERADALKRKQPLNEADLLLNRAARDLVARIRGSAEPASAPVAAREYSSRVRSALGQ